MLTRLFRLWPIVALIISVLLIMSLLINGFELPLVKS